MQEVFFREVAETVVISFPACGNIYMIWNKLRENNFSIDVIDVVREMSPEAGKLLEGYSSRDFSEVYLFFDYDAHNNNLPLKYRSRNVIRELLDTFDNETENGKLYIVSLTCPHLKCELEWNDTTKTWDCPCHGSRYDYQGRLVDNPAQQNSILIN